MIMTESDLCLYQSRSILSKLILSYTRMSIVVVEVYGIFCCDAYFLYVAVNQVSE